jgi:hypothetical protein
MTTLQYYINGIRIHICNDNLDWNHTIYNIRINSKIKSIKIQILETFFQFLKKRSEFIIEIKDLIKCFKFYFDNWDIGSDDTLKEIIKRKFEFNKNSNVIANVNLEMKIYRIHIMPINYYIYVPADETIYYAVKKLKSKGVKLTKLFDKNDNEIIQSTMVSSFNNLEIELNTNILLKLVDEKLLSDDILGSIYLLQDSKFVAMKKPIYKIGKTERNINSRMKSYAKGGYLFLVIGVPIQYTSKIETELKNKFKNKYIQKKEEAGEEYFEGNVDEMMDDIYNYVKNKEYVNVI